MIARILLSLLSFFFFLSVEAQNPEKEIETSIENLNKAMMSKDQPALDKLTADELSYGHSTAVVQNKSAFLKDVISGPVTFSQIENSNQVIQVNGNTAIVRNICTIKGTRDGAPLDLKIGILMIWQKTDSKWKLLARQGYKLP